MSQYDGVRILWSPVGDYWFLEMDTEPEEENETFYDDEGNMRIWDTREECRSWAIDNLGVDPNYYYEKLGVIAKGQDAGDQMRLFK